MKYFKINISFSLHSGAEAKHGVEFRQSRHTHTKPPEFGLGSLCLPCCVWNRAWSYFFLLISLIMKSLRNNEWLLNFPQKLYWTRILTFNISFKSSSLNLHFTTSNIFIIYNSIPILQNSKVTLVCLCSNQNQTADPIVLKFHTEILETLGMDISNFFFSYL